MFAALLRGNRVRLRIAVFVLIAMSFAFLLAVGHYSLSQIAPSDEELRRSAERMAEVARTTFAPVYPALARQIVEDTGIKEGICIELGCGSGALGLALVKVTNLKVYAIDINPYAVAIAQRNAVEAGLGHRFYPMVGDALNLPFKDGFADLVVSRGMIPFIEDKAAVFKEAHRVLKVGGAACIGGGFSRMLDEEMVKRIVAKTIWGSPDKLPMRRIGMAEWERHLKSASITNYRIIQDRYPSGNAYGTWVIFRK